MKELLFRYTLLSKDQLNADIEWSLYWCHNTCKPIISYANFVTGRVQGAYFKNNEWYICNHKVLEAMLR